MRHSSPEHSLSRLIGFMFIRVIDNLLVALERIKIIWKSQRNTQNTFNNLRSEREGPPTKTHMPGVVSRKKKKHQRELRRKE